MTKGTGTSSTSNPKIEWVTLISKDNYQFVIDKRFALRSIFIRSMLGESKTSNIARRGQRAAAAAANQHQKVQTINVSAAQVLETVSADRKNTSTNATMDDRATPPPQGSEMIDQMNGNDPDGYVNPFASNTIANEDESDNDDDDDLEGNFRTFESGFAEAQSNIVKFPDIRGIILEKVVEYLCWNARYFNAKDEDIPDFKHRIRPEIAVELLMAADYLEED